jgi:hypothetical protein
VSEQHAQNAKMATGATEAITQVSTAWVDTTSKKPDMSQLFSNTPINLVGPDNSKEVSEWTPLATLWEQHQQVLASNRQHWLSADRGT